MRTITLLCLLLVSLLVADHARAAASAAPVVTSPQSSSTTPVAGGTLAFLKILAGKYPQEAKLLENQTLAARLKALLGNEYEMFRQDWATETPIQLEQNVIHAKGCKSHACPEDEYFLYIDLDNDNINIYNFREAASSSKEKTALLYKEKKEITLPEGFAKKFKEQIKMFFWQGLGAAQ